MAASSEKIKQLVVEEYKTEVRTGSVLTGRHYSA